MYDNININNFYNNIYNYVICTYQLQFNIFRTRTIIGQLLKENNIHDGILLAVDDGIFHLFLYVLTTYLYFQL